MASKKTRNFWLNEFSLFTSLLIWKREQVISNVPIKTAILQNNGNLTAAAEQLGISRQTLYNKLKRFKL